MTSVSQDTSPRPPERIPSSGTAHRVPGLENAFSVLSRYSDRASTLADCLKKLSQLDVETFGTQLSKVFASAPQPPSIITSHTVQFESMLHLEEAIFRELHSAQPALLSIQRYLERIAPEGDQFLQLIGKISEGLHDLADPKTAQPHTLKLALIDEILRNSSMLVATQEEVTETITKELRSLRHARLSAPQDSELWRQASLAIALHDLKQNTSIEAPAPLAPNELLASLPLFYEIDRSKVTATLTEMCEDPALAETLASNLVHAAMTHQTWRTLIQGELGLSSSAMQAIEQRFPCEELQKLIAEYRESAMVHSLLRRAIIQDNQAPITVDDLREWAKHLDSYCNSLSAMERLAPGISPGRNPELFMPRQAWEHHRTHLEQLRLDSASYHQIYRLASLSAVLGALEEIGGSDLGPSGTYLAMLIVYGFGVPSQVAGDYNTKFELTTQAYRLYVRDLERVAPAVPRAKLDAAEISINSVFEDSILAGIIKQISPSPEPGSKYFQLASAAHVVPQWQRIVRIIRTLREETYKPEVFTADSQQSRSPHASSKRSRPSSSVAKRQDKAIANLQKEFRSVEDTLQSLPTTTREHLIRKQVDTLISAAGRIGEALTSLDVVASTPALQSQVTILVSLLKPTRATDEPKIREYCRTAKTALYLLKDMATDTPSNGGQS